MNAEESKFTFYNILYPIYDYYYVTLKERLEDRFSQLVKIKRAINHFMFFLLALRMMLVVFGSFHDECRTFDYSLYVLHSRPIQPWLNITFAMSLTTFFIYYMSDHAYSFRTDSLSGRFFYNLIVLNRETYDQSLKTPEQIQVIRAKIIKNLKVRYKLTESIFHKIFLRIY